jgi:hypothetical protein
VSPLRVALIVFGVMSSVSVGLVITWCVATALQEWVTDRTAFPLGLLSGLIVWAAFTAGVVGVIIAIAH